MRSEVPPGVVAVLRKMTAKKPEDRYQTPGEVATELTAGGGVSTDSERTIAAIDDSRSQETSGNTYDAAGSAMARGHLAQAEALRADRVTEERRWLKKISLVGGMALVGLLVAVLGMIFLPMKTLPGPKLEQERTEVVKADEPKEIDLLNLVDPKKHAVKGKWQLDQGILESDNSAPALLQIPYAPGAEYELAILAERKTNKLEAIDIGLVVGKTQVVAVIDGVFGQDCFSGVETLDNKAPPTNETRYQGEVLTRGKMNEIVCAVRKGHISVFVNGQRIVDWKGDTRRLAVSQPFRVPNNRQLFIGSWGASYRVAQIRLKPLSGKSGPE